MAARVAVPFQFHVMLFAIYLRSLLRILLRHARGLSSGGQPKTLPSDELIEEERLPDYDATDFYPIKIGDVFNSKYHTVAKLGFGRGSTVWLAKHPPCKYEPQFIALRVCGGEASFTNSAVRPTPSRDENVLEESVVSSFDVCQRGTVLRIFILERCCREVPDFGVPPPARIPCQHSPLLPALHYQVTYVLYVHTTLMSSISVCCETVSTTTPSSDPIHSRQTINRLGPTLEPLLRQPK
jgi:hypothetical protein